MSYSQIPVFNETLFSTFVKAAENQGTKFPEFLPTEPKFLIHVPKLNDGGGDFKFVNVKRANIDYEQNGSTMQILRAEGLPQRVPVDGTGWIVINGADKYDAVGWHEYLQDLLEQHGGKVNRRVLTELMQYIQGFSVTYKPSPDGREEVIDTVTPNRWSVVGFAFDTYTVPVQTKTAKFEDRPVKGYAADGMTGLFYKRAQAYKLFFIPGHFKFQYGNLGVSWKQSLEYMNGAYIAISPTGAVSSIDPSNIDACYGFLKEGISFSDVKPGMDREFLTNRVSPDAPDAPKKVPVFSPEEIVSSIRQSHVQRFSRAAGETRRGGI